MPFILCYQISTHDNICWWDQIWNFSLHTARAFVDSNLDTKILTIVIFSHPWTSRIIWSTRACSGVYILIRFDDFDSASDLLLSLHGVHNIVNGRKLPAPTCIVQEGSMIKSVVIRTVNFCVVTWGQCGHFVTVDGIISGKYKKCWIFNSFFCDGEN